MQSSLAVLFSLCLFLNFNSEVYAQIQSPPLITNEADVTNMKNYSGVVTKQYADGSPALRKTVIDGKAEGLWLEWYPDGTLRYRAYWKNGLGNGKWEYFYPNGELRSESFYIDDVAQGIYKSYHENGQLQTDAVYLNGNLDGIKQNYDATGTPTERERYENGRRLIDESIIFSEGNISSKDSNEWGIAFSPDGKTAYFTRKDAATGKKRIYVADKNESGWSVPEIASFSTDEDEAPHLNSTGNRLFFASFRPMPDGSTVEKYDMNIWFTEKTDTIWSAAKPVVGAVNKSAPAGNIWPAAYEAGPFTDRVGNLYFWTKGENCKATNIYFSFLKPDGSYDKPVELRNPSSDTNYDTAPHLAPDENVLFFSSDNRAGGYGGSDIYYSVKRNGQWSQPENLGPLVNSYLDEGFPSFSPDGKYFYFSSSKAGNKDAAGEYLSDIYYFESKFLMIE